MLNDSRAQIQSPLLDAIRRLRQRPAPGAAPGPPPSLVPADARFGPESDLAAMVSAGVHPVTRPPRPELPRECPSRSRTASEIAADVRSGADAGASAAVDRALGRIGHLDGAIRAFVWLDAPAARSAAAELDARGSNGPLAGVPIAHKDIVWTADAPTTAGSSLLANFVPTEDAEIVTRLRQAGAISLGKLNTHEFATGITGLVSAHGPTLNPTATDRIPGGSSCGSAAAVAAGLVAAATATDTGGSIRIPAACCGVVGFKPTFGAVPTRGVIPFSWTLDHVGSICRTVADAALLFGVMSGTRNEGVEPEASDLRFAMAEEWLAACTPAVAAGIRRVGDALESAGATRVPVQLPDLDAAAAVAGAIFLAEGGAVHAETLARSPEAYCSPTVSFLRQSQRVSGVDYFRAQRHRAALKADFARLYADHGLDLLIAPALPCSPPAVAAVHVELPEGSVEMRAAMTRFTRPFNLTGQPVLCLPVAMDDQAMAVNAQLVGAEGADLAVLRWGQLVEATRSDGNAESG